MIMMTMKKDTKKCAIKQKLKFEDYKNYLELNQLEKNKLSWKNKNPLDSLRKNHEEFIKTNNLILKSQKRFRSKKYTVSNKEITWLHWVLTMIKEYN